MRVIALEEHFHTAESLAAWGKTPIPEQPGQTFESVMADLGDLRLADMDRGGIALQVLSNPVHQFYEMSDPERAVSSCRNSNEAAAEAVKTHPDRFAAFAMLPMMHPDAAADELERTVLTHGFKGALIPGHVQGRFLDDKFFWPVFDRAAALNVPIYLHPRTPPKAVMDAYYAGFDTPVSTALAWAGWGWHGETGLHALRVILGGLFDRYPDLQFIIGHMGENIPYFLDRADYFLSGTAKHLKRRVAEYFHDNFYITTSGFFSVAPLLCALSVVGADRILFSVDYPMADNLEGTAFLKSAPISPADREKIAHGNSERLLRIPPL